MLEKCLDALFTSSERLSLDVWVVDNHSTDGSVEMVKDGYPMVHLIENKKNTGFARANNQAARQCSGEYLLLLNSDAYLQGDALSRMLQAMEAYPDTGALGSQLLNEDLSLQRSCYAFPTLATELWQTIWLDRLFPKSKVFGKYLMTYWRMGDFREVDVVMGACMLVRRAALGQGDLFDESYFMYSEEVDLCYRLKQRGWKVRYLPEAKAVHVWGGSSNQVKVETLVRLYRSRVLFFRKHYGKIPAILYKCILYVNSFSRSISGWLAQHIFRNAGLGEKSAGYRQVLRNLSAF